MTTAKHKQSSIRSQFIVSASVYVQSRSFNVKREERKKKSACACIRYRTFIVYMFWVADEQKTHWQYPTSHREMNCVYCDWIRSIYNKMQRLTMRRERWGECLKTQSELNLVILAIKLDGENKTYEKSETDNNIDIYFFRANFLIYHLNFDDVYVFGFADQLWIWFFAHRIFFSFRVCVLFSLRNVWNQLYRSYYVTLNVIEVHTKWFELWWWF